MPDNEPDPAASTAQFRAYVEDDPPQRHAAQETRSSRTIVYAAIGLAAVAVLAWLLLSG
ncbi:MAG: hypothetical protein ACRDPK_09260 [Carbonactinosporaceae bacterium]